MRLSLQLGDRHAERAVAEPSDLLGAVVMLRAPRERQRAHEHQGRHDLGSTSRRVSSISITRF